MTGGGTLPLRKPGMLICLAMAWYAASRLGLSSSKGTSTVILARVGLNVSTALFTGFLLSLIGWFGTGQCGLCEAVQSRGDRTRTCGLLLPKQAR